MDNNRSEEFCLEEHKPPMDKKLKIAVLILAFLFTVILTSMITFALTAKYLFTPQKDDWKDKADVLKRYIDDYAYFDPDEEAMQDAALKAYVYASGDPYSEYYNEEDFKALYDENYGRYVGIGVTISLSEVVYNGETLSLYEVVRVADGSPAQEAGILCGDLLYSLRENGKETFSSDVGADVFTSMVKGEEGTFVSLSVLRKSYGEYEKIDIRVERRTVISESVFWEISSDAKDVGVVSIYQFDMNTPVELEKSFDYFKKNNIKKAVIDLRGNGGGDLYSVVACASYFVNSGDVIISSEDNVGYKEVYKAQPRSYSYDYSTCNVSENDIGKYRDFEIVVLVDGYTASAAELLTAVFRDYGLAAVVGETTYGKGTMQTIFPLKEEGIGGGIKITTDIYFPPCGENYDGIGIIPDVTVEHSGTEEDNQLKAAIELLS
ncbi:MAG: hypothetical protein IJW79_12070 [Clostridia bacterium]|nr:hypothetical protein [Clostridia bacterium]